MTRGTAALAILGAILAVGAIMFLIDGPTTTVSTTDATAAVRDTTLIKYMIAAVLAIAALVILFRFLPAAPAGGWGASKPLVWIVIAVVLLVLVAIFRNELFALTKEDWSAPKGLASSARIIVQWAIFLALGMGLLILVFKANLEGHDRLLVFALWAFVILLIGPLVANKDWIGITAQQQAAASAAPTKTIRPVLNVPVGPNWLPFNPTARPMGMEFVRGEVIVGDHTAKVCDPDRRINCVRAKAGDRLGNLPFRVTAVKASQGSAIVSYHLE